MAEVAFTDEELRMMNAIDSNHSSEFVALVTAAGLDPMRDFRHKNLRGIDIRGSDLSDFDLSGSDLTGALVSDSTIWPRSDFLQDTVLQVIDQEDPPTIVSLMAALEKAGEKDRDRLLRQLIEGYDSDIHIDRFILSQLRKKPSAEVAADFFSFLSPSYQVENEAIIAPVLASILEKEINRRGPRKKVLGRTPASRVNRLILEIANSELGAASEAAIRYRRGEINRQDFLTTLKRA